MLDEFMPGTGEIEMRYTDNSRVTLEGQAWCGHCDWRSTPRPDVPIAAQALHHHAIEGHRVYFAQRRCEVFGLKVTDEDQILPIQPPVGRKKR